MHGGRAPRGHAGGPSIRQTQTDAHPGRRASIVIAAVLAVALPSLPAAPPATAVEAGPPFIPGELIIAFERGVTDAQVADFHDDFDLEQEEDLDADPRDRDPEETLTDVPAVTDALIAQVESDPRVDYAEPNYILRIDATPSDPEYGRLWGLDNTGQTGGTTDADIDAPEAWEITTGSADVVVGVIDTGVNYGHQDLAPNMWVNPGEVAGNGVDDDANGYIDDVHGINAITDSGNPADDHGHGTHVSGTIGAAANNGIGVAGVAWSARIAACKFLSASGSGSTSNAIKCFKYFNELKNRSKDPVNVVLTNNSWGGGGFSQSLQDAMVGLDQPGMPRILHVCAAGNSNVNNDAGSFYPSTYPIDNVLSVAATDRNDRYASFSSWGATSVDLAAPGASIYSTYIPGNAYTSMSGTSMATPHVSGAAVLVKSVNPSFGAAELKQRLMASVDPIGGLSGNAAKPTVTNGRLNLLRAVETDVTAPAAATIGTGAVTSTSVTLAWTATGDDGTAGTSTSYDLRYSTSPITDASWASATRATGEPTPQPAGSAETYTVTGLAHATAYHFALKVADNLGNESGLSNVATATTAGPPRVLQVTDGWDKRTNTTLVQTGTLSRVGSSDNSRVLVERGQLWSFQFDDPALPAGATVLGVKIYVEHSEESGFAGSVAWQVHTGSLTNPDPVALQSLNAPIRVGSSAEGTDAWDVSSTINEPAEAAAMKLVIRNNGTTSARTRIDRVYADVSYSTGPDTTAPETTISSGPSGRVNSTSAGFTYTSSESGSSFACRLDGGAFSSCAATGVTYPGLGEGSHTFEVQATDAADNTDASPAARTWTVDVTAPQVVDPTSPAGSASAVPVGTQVRATFSEEMAASTITGSSFTLVVTSSGGAVPGAVSYDAATRTATISPTSPLAGSTSYTARVTTAVRDLAGNAPAAQKSWSFTTAAAPDTTAPDTTISSGPSGKVSSTTAAFTYTSSESGSSFACRLDGGAFASCPASGVSYPGLTEGSHTFEVQATDAADNTDGSPAARTWTVDVTAPQVVDPTTPAAGASGVAASTPVRATFSEEMTASTISASSFTLAVTSSGTGVTGAVTYDAAARTATFTPGSALAANTSYTARISTAAKDVAGNGLGAAKAWSFTTAAAAAGQTLHLHNQPSPPVGNTTAQKNMAMNGTAPSATTLYQYSTDFYTGGPGRSVEKSAANAAQAEPKYMANWVYQVGAYTAFSGNAELKIWVAMKDLKCDKTPSFTVYLREKSSSTTDAGTTLATATATSPPPGSSEPCGLRQLTVTLPLAGTDVAAGNWLELKISVNEATGDSALLAYDTATYGATLRLP